MSWTDPRPDEGIDPMRDGVTDDDADDAGGDLDDTSELEPQEEE